ncbi:MAG TPA: lipoyl synthase [Candidatus Thermoplasmatota archaeon]|nr:lipoyl synthase [Candidatus Thermoplasmatota archaeon]
MTLAAERKPRWLLRPLPKGPAVAEMTSLLREHGLHTVCEEARCPNRGECWSQGEATLMLMGDTCTRACRFCDVAPGRPGPLDPDEPAKVALTVSTLKLTYAVLTSVDRDDLPDQGAGHWARTILAVRAANPATIVDVLVPDFQGREDLIRVVVGAGPHVLAHNVETVRRLQRKVRDARASYEQSLAVHRTFKRLAPRTPVKSGLMLGLGETRDEVVETLRDLRAAGVDFVTLGQYLRPTERHLPVERYVPPEAFEDLAAEARAMGFAHVVAGPFVRSSYRAWEVESIVRGIHGLPREGGA